MLMSLPAGYHLTTVSTVDSEQTNFKAKVMLQPMVSQPVSWYQAPSGAPRPDFCYYLTAAGLFMWGTLFDEKMGLSFNCC
jgi:hypothetical protein